MHRPAVAVHEAGHAVVAALGAHADPIAKVTVLPAGQTLGPPSSFRWSSDICSAGTT